MWRVAGAAGALLWAASAFLNYSSPVGSVSGSGASDSSAPASDSFRWDAWFVASIRWLAVWPLLLVEVLPRLLPLFFKGFSSLKLSPVVLSRRFSTGIVFFFAVLAVATVASGNYALQMDRATVVFPPFQLAQPAWFAPSSHVVRREKVRSSAGGAVPLSSTDFVTRPAGRSVALFRTLEWVFLATVFQLPLALAAEYVRFVMAGAVLTRGAKKRAQRFLSSSSGSGRELRRGVCGAGRPNNGGD
jgi:hypothetical protein